MTRSTLVQPGGAFTATDAIPEIANLLASVYCACEQELRHHVATLACELFRRVDIDGESLAAAARALDLEARDAEAILAIIRRDLAAAVAGCLCTGRDG
ncbi:hypothetical protein SAMN04487972_101239 [Paracoccus halophilus]|uniref:Uncharacterized protein n=1 Tax=Paracoccus halophilus TaxID=376733 RepID=A0A099F2K9_9RHOB|nr:hypothetical protein [Paracoccus halophilus]KGJ04915.1 hypothetical protein IT41_07735 [Paracoccus halophilus]SFA39079.1 hypothetical protein SAMN04487972_101239 [Paracoccus halophilus]